MRLAPKSLGLAALLGLAVGCGPNYDRVEIDHVSLSDLPGEVSQREIRIPVGGVTTARVTAYDTNDSGMLGDVVSDDPSVLAVERTTATNGYAFIGTKLGATRVRVYADGILVVAIPALVVDQ